MAPPDTYRPDATSFAFTGNYTIEMVMRELYDYFSTTSTKWNVANPHGGVKVSSIAAAGSGYAVGNTLTVSGGTGTAATLTVTSVDGGGGVTGVSVATEGAYTVYPANPVSVTGGGGAGATFNLEGNGSYGFTATPVASAAGGFQVNFRRNTATAAFVAIDPAGTITDSAALTGASAGTSAELQSFQIAWNSTTYNGNYENRFHLFEWDDAIIILQEDLASRYHASSPSNIKYGMAAGKLFRPVIPGGVPQDGFAILGIEPDFLSGTNEWMPDNSSTVPLYSQYRITEFGIADDWKQSPAFAYGTNPQYMGSGDTGTATRLTQPNPVVLAFEVDNPKLVARYFVGVFGTGSDFHRRTGRLIVDDDGVVSFMTFNGPSDYARIAIPIPATFNPLKPTLYSWTEA